MIKEQVSEKIHKIALALNINFDAVRYGAWLLAERVLEYPCLTAEQMGEIVYRGDTAQIEALKQITPAAQEAFTLEELEYVFKQLPSHAPVESMINFKN